MKKIRIEPSKWYTLLEIVEKQFFEWCHADVRTYRKYVHADIKGENVLRPMVVGSGRGKRYKFQGSNIIKFISRVKDGTIRL